MSATATNPLVEPTNLLQAAADTSLSPLKSEILQLSSWKLLIESDCLKISVTAGIIVS
ncbi:hypothetical protein [Nostoc sp. MG11]|uniref:hypothetical protein n=1 Tax=Nostoc sp. MG11 TaxID=2721166 RepID=UPI0018684BD8|nr:hypothetical protein [Nostoc sp. MG11]